MFYSSINLHFQIDSRSTDELRKLFNKLNTKDNEEIIIGFGTLPDQVVRMKTNDKYK